MFFEKLNLGPELTHTIQIYFSELKLEVLLKSKEPPNIGPSVQTHSQGYEVFHLISDVLYEIIQCSIAHIGNGSNLKPIKTSCVCFLTYTHHCNLSYLHLLSMEVLSCQWGPILSFPTYQ
jgi:hypothetical protein